MGDVISDEAVQRATGRAWQEWFVILDGWGASEMDHAAIARRLAETTDTPGWWCQAITVQYERARGLRDVGEAKSGWQFSVQRTLPLDAGTAWRALLAQEWLPEAVEEGASFAFDGNEATVRAVRPGALLRIWIGHATGRSTLEIWFLPKQSQTTVRFTHSGLPDRRHREAYRVWWRGVLGGLA